MAQSVAEHFAQRELIEILDIEVPVDVPPVGLITLRGRNLTPITQRLAEIMRTNSKARTLSRTPIKKRTD
jgi:DNA-binding transcriptional LysR family regulator